MFAAGVRLLTIHNPGDVTKAIFSRLQTLAATGDYVGQYEWGKLEYAPPLVLSINYSPPHLRHTKS